MLNEAGNKPLLRAQIARRGPRQGTSHPCAHKSRAGDPGREQGNKKTGETLPGDTATFNHRLSS